MKDGRIVRVEVTVGYRHPSRPNSVLRTRRKDPSNYDAIAIVFQDDSIEYTPTI